MDDLKLYQQYRCTNNTAVLLCNRSVTNPGGGTVSCQFLETFNLSVHDRRVWATPSTGLPTGVMYGGYLWPRTTTVADKAQQEPLKAADEAMITKRQASNLLEVWSNCSKN
jgi:hypothetical protein